VALAIEEVRRIYRPHLIIVHRDAERESWEARRREVPSSPGVAPIIPIRMTEAWLLIEERAIRRAAGRPSGREPLGLPPPRALEARPDPKRDLDQALLRAAGDPTGRRGRWLRGELPHLRFRVAEEIQSYEPLRELSAFRRWEEHLTAALQPLD
jgi:hypothetical protein